MKQRSIFIIFLVFLYTGTGIPCFSQSSEKTRNGNLTKTLVINNEFTNFSKDYQFVKDLESKNKKTLGSIYVKKINDSIFNSLIISDQGKVIYYIENLNFWNINGVDFDIAKERTNFFGYKFVLLKSDYFVLGGLYDKGRKVSDDITITWNTEKQIFEVQIEP